MISRRAAKRLEKRLEAHQDLERRIAEGEGELDIISAYAPLVNSLARRYEGRGADEEDLRQEARLALIKLAKKYARQTLAREIARRVPSMVRDAAERLRGLGKHGHSRAMPQSFDEPTEDGGEFGDFFADSMSESMFDAVETRASLETLLPPAELATAKMLASGMSRSEVAEADGVTRQAVSARLARMKSRLAALYD